MTLFIWLAFQISDYDSHSPALLHLFISADPSNCSMVAFCPSGILIILFKAANNGQWLVIISPIFCFLSHFFSYFKIYLIKFVNQPFSN